ncbi:LysR family transcriptional regulator [Paenarthrobacter nitroguajacolicus]|uniref:LysR family transcriptional regulator n=1 Tax=Paenarthrobacter nitroguajacolicus TaxID=211146 RepID=UPI0028546A49|nr:LysR family transcriptional regulator [Paenarthrobacter nitroguajacolicus]MDR6637005.1 DNA-binding transcriptional LysR family regulator [Paenarthrobacter nitroguajacolicus]
MELRQLRYFLVVADELHFGRAAERLHLTQPPLTVAIRRLETELGVQLFDRTTRRVALTPAGEAFRNRIQAAVMELDDAAGDVASVAAGLSGRIRVGFVSSASYTTIPEAIRAFRELRPRVELALRPLTSGEQFDQLLDGELDLGVVRDPGEVPGLTLQFVSTEELVAVMPEAHPLTSSRAEIRPEDFEGEPMILFPYRLMPGFVARVLRLFDGAGLSPNVIQQSIHQETVLGLVAAGLGISILPESVSRFQMPGVVAKRITGHPQTSLFAAHLANPSPAVDEFLQCLQDAEHVEMRSKTAESLCG